MTRKIAAALCAILLAPSALSAEPRTVTVMQADRAFSETHLGLAPGDRVRFTNRDEFLHQVYVDGEEFSFDSDEQSPGDVVDVVFPTEGTHEVRCGIHPKMRLTVDVK